MKGGVWLGEKGKLSPRYVSTYNIARRFGKVDYELELSLEMNMIHLVFQV